MLRMIISGVALIAAPFFMVVPAVAAEVINSFDVQAYINRDGTVDITERIVVVAEGNQINHGIYRDIPTEFKDANGKSFHMPLKVKNVKRDGQKEPYRIVSLTNGQRIYIGDKNKYPRGQQVYEIQYRVARVIGFFPTGDEFYWNVTGNGWVFPITEASITVTFPDGEKVIKEAGYTGRQGAKDTFYKTQIFGNQFSAVTTKALAPYEGFTIVAAVPVGTIAKETTWQRIKYYFEDNADVLIWFSFAFLSILYLTQAWVIHGRDVKGVIIPRFDAPKDIGPDLLRYIYNQSYDVKCFSTLIINAVTHQKIKMEDGNKTTILTLNSDAKSGDTIPNMSILYTAFGGLGSIVLPQKRFMAPKIEEATAERMREALKRHTGAIKHAGEHYVDRNAGHTGFGLVIGILGAIWATYIAIDEDQKLLLIIGSIVFYAFIFELFRKIMPQYTLAGQDAMDHALGLRMYMKTAEEHRLNALYPVEVTPEKFEALLPYAMALDVDQEWCEYMNLLIKAGVVVAPAHWADGGWNYTGYRWGGSSLSSLTSTISSASAPPASSSGFGGGSSGGGGGGGGGGGW